MGGGKEQIHEGKNLHGEPHRNKATDLSGWGVMIKMFRDDLAREYGLLDESNRDGPPGLSG